ncbi:hypothetical protein D0T49_09155 [Paludibacter sp. 221]|uniref:hypothetical protein n=1 Tax=Paludibacter sp. 221 TaxID=2302939 RepID=UPI0013D044B9|nr:hypothetical protein [Paludibacter sp. 221]NDV47211.1 hypothetical protein [Paludibacter sp. 221]
MKEEANNKIILLVSLVILIYCLLVLSVGRHITNTGVQFELWNSYYLLFAIVIPVILLLPAKLFPASGYKKFIVQRENKIRKIIVIVTIILLVWLLLWHAMAGIGCLMKEKMKSLKTLEAEAIALVYIENDSIVNLKAGVVDSIKQTSGSFSKSTAKINYIVYGKDTCLNATVLLIREEEWALDEIVIK